MNRERPVKRNAPRMSAGLPLALSLTLTAPLRAPAAVGVKVTLTLQPSPGAKVAGSVPPLHA